MTKIQTEQTTDDSSETSGEGEALQPPAKPTLTYYECQQKGLDPERFARRANFKCRATSCTSVECYIETSPEQMVIFRCVECLQSWEVATGGAFRG